MNMDHLNQKSTFAKSQKVQKVKAYENIMNPMSKCLIHEMYNE